MKVPYHNSGMAAPNCSTVNYDMFILTGVPGLKELYTWISIPFCLMYLVAVSGNGILICAVAVASSAGYSLVAVHGLLTVEHGLQVHGL